MRLPIVPVMLVKIPQPAQSVRKSSHIGKIVKARSGAGRQTLMPGALGPPARPLTLASARVLVVVIMNSVVPLALIRRWRIIGGPAGGAGFPPLESRIPYKS